jgi:branched-chain amino acid transport system substrate-binding protein
MKVAGRAIEVMERDSMGKPDVAKAELSAAYADDRADIAFGAAGSGVSLAMLPVAEEYQKLLIIEPAVADSITGAKWNPYVFRTARNSTQDAVANAIALDEPGLAIGTLAQDNAFGRDGVTAFRQALKQARIVHEEYLPPATSDFTAGAQRLIDKLKDHAGRRIIFISWAGSGNPFKIADLDLTRYGIEVATGGNILPQLANYKAFPGMQGATYYFYGIPDNAMNAEMVKRHLEKFGAPPDFFTAGGFSAAMALVTAFEKTGGVTDTHTLRAAMRGMTFQTPKGRMVFRAEDHQALQSMYHFKIRVDPAVKWAIPEKVREITLEEIDVPIQNRHAVR